eukprot:TRINITY_DN3481_c0_g1_i1.p1 TRINITY_DN3481_c0_g1~~TRINITY_DN3481_c0_g1_i1.p1  ORF type:complete len:135 (+),score=15.98 TRINITY_DN3481_c0_g1_i1:78-482(+)
MLSIMVLFAGKGCPYSTYSASIACPSDTATTVTFTNGYSVQATKTYTSATTMTATITDYPSCGYTALGKTKPPSPSPSSSSGTNSTVAIAVGAGGGAVGLIIIGIAIYCCWKRRKQYNRGAENKNEITLTQPLV